MIDAIIKFEDGTSNSFIDYKTSKFKEKNGKDFSKELRTKSMSTNFMDIVYYIQI